MAKNLTKTAKDWDNYDALRIELAIRELAASKNLRYFINSLLVGCGVSTTPRGSDALETQFLCGRHSVGMDLLTTILQHDQTLYPALIEEDQNEQRDRQRTTAGY